MINFFSLTFPGVLQLEISSQTKLAPSSNVLRIQKQMALVRLLASLHPPFPSFYRGSSRKENLTSSQGSLYDTNPNNARLLMVQKSSVPSEGTVVELP